MDSLKSVHFKNTVTRSSFHSLSFEWNEGRVTVFLKWTDFSVNFDWWKSFNQELLVIVCGLVRCDEPLPDEVINALTNNKAAHKLILEHFPNSLLAKTISLEDNLVKQNLTPTTNSPNSTKNVIKLKRKVSSLFKNSHKPLRPILKKPKTSHEDEVRISVDDNDDDEIVRKKYTSSNLNSFMEGFFLTSSTVFNFVRFVYMM